MGSSGAFGAAGGSEELVAAGSLGHEVVGVDVQAGLGDPRAIGGRVGVVPPHRGGAAEPIVLSSGPLLGSGGRQQRTAGPEPRGNALEQARLHGDTNQMTDMICAAA